MRQVDVLGPLERLLVDLPERRPSLRLGVGTREHDCSERAEEEKHDSGVFHEDPLLGGNAA